ncbi:predicted protein [Postia placenta Mad-698-R]|nr:predicted protein [Postia placenta Mad-698-R]
MATRTITDLPVELLVMIFFFLDARGLINCKQVCRMFLQLIHGSTSLQYFYELELAGMADEPLCPLPYVERLRKLRSLQHMRRTAELVPGSSFPQWTALVWTTSPGGLFAQADMRGGIEFIQFPSSVLRVSERQWSIHSDQLDMDLETMCMDPSQNVVVVTGWDQVPNEPGEINLSDTGKYDELDEENRKEGRQSRLEGDYVAHLSSWNYEYAVLVWDWKTGDLLWESTICRAFGIYLQRTAEPLSSSCWTDQAYILVFQPSFEVLTAYGSILYAKTKHSLRPVSCQRTKADTRRGIRLIHSTRPPQRGLVAVACYGVPYSLESEDVWTEVILVPASMIREWVLRAQADRLAYEDSLPVGGGGLVEWAEWAPYYPRMVRAGRPFSAEVQGMYAIFANVEGEELVLDHIDYTAVGGKEVEGDLDTYSDLGDEWDEGGELYLIPEDSEGVHSAYALLQPGNVNIPKPYLVILPDYAILQEYKDDDGDNQWQIYHIVASDSGDSIIGKIAPNRRATMAQR